MEDCNIDCSPVKRGGNIIKCNYIINYHNYANYANIILARRLISRYIRAQYR